VSDEADLPPGRQLLKLTVEPTAAAIKEFVDRIQSGGAGRRPLALKLLALAPAEEVAYLTARIIVNEAAHLGTAQHTAFAIAAAIVDHAEMVRLKESNGAGYKGLVKAQQKHTKRRRAVKDIMRKENVGVTLTQAEMLSGGIKAIEVFCDATGLFVMELQPRGRGDMYVIRPTEAVQGWLENQHARCEILEPIHLPMVVRPRRWRSPFWGGYLTKRPGLRLVKQWNAPYHSELRNVDMPAVYDAVNAVQSTPWRINRRVLEVMRTVWDSGGSLGGLPRRDNEDIPPRPLDFDDNPEARAGWKASAAQAHSRNSLTLSKRLAVSQRLWIADKFAAEERIYFPHELDFRGRIYPVPVGGPHPQGEDSAKALIEFADGKPLGNDGAWWLAIHIANLFGVDKVPFEERVDWVMANDALILDSASDPLDGRRFWTSADSPYSALAACFEWAGYVAEREAFVSHIPVALDGSNSGLQHFSAMLRDPEGARAVNLLPTIRPQDVYSEVATAAQARAEAEPVITITTKPDGKEVVTILPNPWLGGKIVRKLTKRPTMTYTYSSTRFGMQGMVMGTLRDLDKENAEQGLPPYLGGADSYKASMWLSHILWETIQGAVPAAAAAMLWLREVAKVVSKTGQPIWWTSPQGLPVLQAYRTVRAERIKVHWGGQRIDLVVAVDEESINRRAQVNGIAPNFVHTLDAAHLMATVNELGKHDVHHVAVIHDSFGVHAADAPLLSWVLRKTFIDQYTPDVLARFRDELAEQLPEELRAELPPLPKLGTLDLSLLAGAEYMFA
jgi:DNA-directed RNA polymerase